MLFSVKKKKSFFPSSLVTELNSAWFTGWPNPGPHVWSLTIPVSHGTWDLRSFFPGFPVTVSKCLRKGGLFCLAFYFCLVVMITYILFMTLAHTGDTRIPPKLDEDYSTQTRWTIFPLSGFFLIFRTLSRSKMSLTLPYQSQDL